QTRHDTRRAERQADQRIEHLPPCPVLGTDAAAHAVGIIIEPGCGRLELLHDALAARLPIRTLEHDDEIVAADMAEKIQPRVDLLCQQRADELNDVIAAPEAIGIVEWLEVVEI